jgi:hypothetical protein
MGGFIVLGGVVWVVCIIVAVSVARQKGRREWVWGLLAILTGPLAMFAVVVMDPVRGASHASTSAKRTDPRAGLYEVPKDKRRH